MVPGDLEVGDDQFVLQRAADPHHAAEGELVEGRRAAVAPRRLRRALLGLPVLVRALTVRVLAAGPAAHRSHTRAAPLLRHVRLRVLLARSLVRRRLLRVLLRGRLLRVLLLRYLRCLLLPAGPLGLLRLVGLLSLVGLCWCGC